MRYAAFATTLVLFGLAIAGCGGRSASPAGVFAPSAIAALTHARLRATGASLTGISGDGQPGMWFSTFEGGGITFQAQVVNPDNQPLRYHWDTNGGAWGPSDQASFEFNAMMWGTYQVSCTLSDAAGNALGTQSVTVEVFNNPSPPPIPNPPIPPR